MTPIEALHTFTRRYCTEQARFWHERYATSGVNANSTKAQTIYRRYHALDAILVKVERKTPADFAALEEMLNWLIIAGRTAENFFTRLPLHQTGAAEQAMDEEREKFCEALRVFVMDWLVAQVKAARADWEAHQWNTSWKQQE